MRHYNRTAHIYEAQYGEEQSLKIEAALKDLESKGQSLALDLGCGTGLLVSKIQDWAEQVVGLDLSKSMLKETRASARHGANIHLVLADGDYTPFRDGCFDAVFAITLMQNMPKPHCAIEEMKRITQTGGLIIVTGLKKTFTESSFMRLLEDGGLKPRLLRSKDVLKCHIAICEKRV